MLCPAYTGHLWSHREESNLQPTDYKTVALPVELRWHICAVSLRLTHPGLGGDIMISHSQGSFQRDSAFLTLKGCHYTRSRPAMATGRPLVISLARYATPIRQYSVSPQSFAAWRARPSAQFMGWFSAVQRRGPILPASVPGGRKGGCGKSPAHAGGRGCRNRTCDMRAKPSCLTAWRIPCVMLWRRLVKAVIPLYPPWKGTPDFPLPPYRVGVGRGVGASPPPALSLTCTPWGAGYPCRAARADTPIYCGLETAYCECSMQSLLLIAPQWFAASFNSIESLFC